VVVLEETDDAELRREVPAPRRAGRAAADEVKVRVLAGAAVAGMAGLVAGVLAGVLPAEDPADGARPMIGGVDILGVPGADPLGVEGLDHELKKSSSVSSLFVAGAGAPMPSTTIPLGNLRRDGSLVGKEVEGHSPGDIVLDPACQFLLV